MQKNSTSKKKNTAVQQKQLTLDDLLAHIVDVRPSLGHKIIRFLLDEPEKNVLEIAHRLGTPKGGLSTAAQYALEGITLTVMEPDNEKLRHDVAMALTQALIDNSVTPDAALVILEHLGRLQDPITADTFLCALPASPTLSTPVIRALRRIDDKREWPEDKVKLISLKLKRLPPNIRDRYCLALIEAGQEELTQESLENIFSKPSAKRNTLDLALIDAAAKKGFKSVFPFLMQLLESKNKYEKGHAIQSLVDLIEFYAAKAASEGGFENYIQALEDEECNCEDEDCEDEECDCEEDNCECGCHEHHHDEDGDNEENDEDYDFEEDYDFQACRMAKEFFTACPCVASLGALVRAYGETKDTASITAAALANPDAKMRDFAQKLLKNQFAGSKYDDFIYKLAIDSTNPDEKSRLLEILGARNVAQARPYLMSMLQDSNPVLAQAALKALSAMPGDATLLQTTIDVLKTQRNSKKQKNNPKEQPK